MRFRLNRVAIIADIENTFRTLGLEKHEILPAFSMDKKLRQTFKTSRIAHLPNYTNSIRMYFITFPPDSNNHGPVAPIIEENLYIDNLVVSTLFEKILKLYNRRVQFSKRHQ